MLDLCDTAKPVREGTLDDLRRHLVAASNIELWTIPLYLTALYSIREDESSVILGTGRRGRPTTAERSRSTVSRLLASVCLQEMLHLQIAGNLCTLFGVAPPLDWPTYDGVRIPYLFPRAVPEDVEVRLGTATDPNTFALLVAVESPDEQIKRALGGELPDVPNWPTIQYDANGQPIYPSIGVLYSVVAQLARRFRAEANPGAPQIVNGLFTAWFPRVAAIGPASLDDAINLIVDQGEGQIQQDTAPLDDKDALPSPSVFRPPFGAEDHFSHEERFGLCQQNGGTGLSVYGTSGQADTAQANLSQIFGRLLDGLRAGWAGQPPDLSPMFLMRAAMTQVFQAHALPAFAPRTDTPGGYAGAAEDVAPASGATWGRQVRWFFTLSDIAAMRANGLSSPDLSSERSVHANREAILALTRNSQMPPGGLNQWSAEQILSFLGWSRSKG